MRSFVLKQDYTFEVQVPVRTPDGEVFDFVAKFRVIPLTPETTTVEIVSAFEGWRGIVGPDGNELPVTPENREALLRWPFVRVALAGAYMAEVHKLPEKNSAAPAAPGPAKSLN